MSNHTKEPWVVLDYGDHITISAAQRGRALHTINGIECGGRMVPGVAIEQTWSGSPDFPNGEVVTMSPGGRGKLIDCLKCDKCGHSVSRDQDADVL